MKIRLLVLILFGLPSSSLTSQEFQFIKVDGGEFIIGDSQTSESSPIHKVTLDSFYVSKELITRGDYESIFGTPFLGDAKDQDNYSLSSDERKTHVTDISWIRALEYCNKVSIKAGLDPYYSIPERCWEPKDITINSNSNGYRLLTEAEWEFLRGYHHTEIDDLDDTYYEWVWDGFVDYAKGHQVNPIDLSGEYDRVIRGGITYNRLKAPAADRHMYGDKTSFRLAKSKQ